MSGSLDCFQYLLGQVASWIHEVEEVEKRIAEKQAEIAQLPPSTSRPRLKKSGSSESIRPGREDEEAYHHEGSYTTTTGSKGSQSPILQRAVIVDGPEADVVSAPAGLQDRTTTGSSRVVLRKRKPASIMSSATAPLKYRSRSAIIVEYDAKVQTAFNQLVQNISQGRNRIRKTRMGARMMSLSASSYHAEANDDADGEPLSPMAVLASRSTTGRRFDSTPTFRSTRRMASAVSPMMRAEGMSASSSASEQQAASLSGEEAFDQADKLLEEAQSQCERGAHQFLRDGDCEEQTEEAKQRFTHLKALCDAEITKIEGGTEKRGQVDKGQRQQASEAECFGGIEMTPPSKAMIAGQLLQMEGTIEADDDSVDGDDDDGQLEVGGDARFELSSTPMPRCRVMART